METDSAMFSNSAVIGRVAVSDLNTDLLLHISVGCCDSFLCGTCLGLTVFQMGINKYSGIKDIILY